MVARSDPPRARLASPTAISWIGIDALEATLPHDNFISGKVTSQMCEWLSIYDGLDILRDDTACNKCADLFGIEAEFGKNFT